MEFSDNSRLKLFPLIIRPFGEDNFRVLRWGGNSKVLTRQFGCEAIRLLQKGHTLGETKTALAQKHKTNPTRVDLAPLLQSLHKAGLIKTIDGHPAGDRSGTTVLNSLWFLWRYFLSPAARKFSETFLPITISRRLAFWTHWLDLKRGMKPALLNAGRNIATTWPGKTPLEVQRLVANFYRHWIWNIVDVDIFENREPEAVDRWMNRHTSCAGLDHLEQARQQKNGVILCIFHFSSTRLIPLFLMKRGYPVTAIGPANMGWGMGKTLGVLDRFKTSLPSYGPLRLFGDFKVANLHALVDALRNGEVACCMADVIPGPPSGEHALAPELVRYFGYSAQEFPRAAAPVEFFGQRLEMTAWVGWLAALSGATVLPTLMLRNQDQSLELRIGPPAVPHVSPEVKTRDAINASLYQTLEEYVVQHPSQWFAWHNLHHVGLRNHPEAVAPRPAQPQVLTISS